MEPDVAEDVRNTADAAYSWWTTKLGCIAPRTILSYDQLQRAYDLCQPSGRVILNPSPLQGNNMTKKNFIAIAEHLNFFHNSSEYVFDELVNKMCSYFHYVNLNFDENKFRDAVYKKKE